MKRRCEFLEDCPAFNYNCGVGLGEFQDKQDQSDQSLTDTRRLGSTIMRTMLKEVGNFCCLPGRKKPSEPHQQVNSQAIKL